MAVNQDKLDAFLGRFVGDLGATIAAGSVVVGHRLGLYRALAEGPATPDELAARTRTVAALRRASGCRGQAAGGYVEYDPATGAFSLTEEQAFALADPDGPLYLPGAFVLALGALRAEPRITEAFRTGAGWAGTSTTRTCSSAASCSSGPATSPTWCRAGSRRWTGSTGKLEAGAPGRRRGLRARRVDGAARPGLPGLDGRRLRLPRRARSSWPASAAAEAGVADRVDASRWRRRRPSPAPATTW